MVLPIGDPVLGFSYGEFTYQDGVFTFEVHVT